MSDVHEAKYREMQKYVPFIQRVIEKLKVNNDHQADNPRKAQLHKMEMLHELLTNKHKKIKIETLTKCEGVLIKLQAKIEKNDDLILSDVKLKQQPGDSENISGQENGDILGPASPPPELLEDDDLDQPVVIPTERRSSPKLAADKLQECNIEKTDQSIKPNLSESVSEPFESLRKKVFSLDCKDGASKFVTSKHNSTKDSKYYRNSTKNTSQHKSHHTTEFQHGKHFNRSRQSSQVPKKNNADNIKTSAHSATGQTLQTVKMFITEPLPAHVKKQHSSSPNQHISKPSPCNNRLRTLPPATLTKVDNNNEVYSPEELWDQYNQSRDNKDLSERPCAAAKVFSRCDDKLSESSSSSCSTNKASGRYTPIPDVLKSPPLSVSDINNLLLESGSDKILHDISDIGSRRQTKNQDYRKSPSNSFELVRKKLAQTARMSSSRAETPKPPTEKDVSSISSVPHERIALKYNPHPRQERSMSISSTEGSECSLQSTHKVIDPRIKSKLQTNSSVSHSPTQVATSNVNVLPAINLSDPRLKKQTTIPMPSMPTAFTATPKVNLTNQSLPNYATRKDPRISRITNNNMNSIQTTPARRMNTNQAHYSSEENWDSDEQDRTLSANKSDPRFANKDHHRIESRHGRGGGNNSFDRSHSLSRDQTPIASHSQNLPAAAKLSLLVPEKKAACNKVCPQLNTVSKVHPHKIQCTNKQNAQGDTAFIIPNPPKSDTEDDWDSDPESNTKQKQFRNEAPPYSSKTASPAMPTTSSYHTQISPIAFMSPKHVPSVPVQPIHVTPIHPSPPQYPVLVGTNIHPSFRAPNTVAINRFNSLLNDNSERIKYLESKKQKANEPRTYKEFREAKERAQAQEAAIKRAAEEAKAKKRCDELKEYHKGKETTESAIDKKEKQSDTLKKLEDDKKEKKLLPKDNKKPLTGESTLDKMYRTQNFNSNFPKANTSFKIPKKKTEEKLKEELVNTNEAPAEQSQNLSKSNKNTISPNHSEIASDKAKPIHEEVKSTNRKLDDQTDHSKCGNNEMKSIPDEPITCKQPDTNVRDKLIEKHEASQSSKESPSTLHEFIIDKIEENPNDKTIAEGISCTKPNEKENKAQKEAEMATETEAEAESKGNKNDKSQSDDNKVNARDPRCRPKPILETAEFTKEEKGKGDEDKDKDKFKIFGDIVITSSENQVVLKPQQNLDKFNKLTQEIKPQRILRRRNTMVVFDSVPLVDKEKLKKANALLFEDVQEEEKRKRKQAEEERLAARRNKNLEEMFKKTDDNCTVSTQNIITGKRRTRAAINFNETVNAQNVFKHITVKDPSAAVNSSATHGTRSVKALRTNFKIKVKNLSFKDAKCDESDDDETLEALVRKQAKIKKEMNEHKIKPLKKTTLKNESKGEEIETETKIVSTKKRGAPNKKSSSNNAPTSNDNKFKPIQNDEHQNCAVSSTSADVYTVEEAKCSSTSANVCFKRETDDNEPTSTAHKSNNPTPTPEPNEPVLNEIVDQILTPNGNREHILGVLSQILSEDKLELIKSLIEKSNKEDEQIGSEQKCKTSSEEGEENRRNMDAPKMDATKNPIDRNMSENDGNDEGEPEDSKPLKSNKSGIASGTSASGGGDGGKKINLPKKKRTELDRLNEDIRDMFICNGVITATGRRMCTIMGKDVAASTSKNSTKESTPTPCVKQENMTNKKDDALKPPIITRSLRRSIRGCKVAEDNEDNESTQSRSTQDSFDDSTSNVDSSIVADKMAQRKMPILTPHTPVKIPEEFKSATPNNTKELGNSKRKSSDSAKHAVKAKKSKSSKDGPIEHSEAEEDKEFVTQAGEVEKDAENNKNCNTIRNTNVHWHNQSKYSTWCMICEKKFPASLSSAHYKTHHGENYISRMAPVLLQKFKQGKLNKPLFGVKKVHKQPSWFYRCPFCLKYFNTPMSLWLEHFLNHTVELRYECSKCHRCSNRKTTVSRHIKSCEGATIINSAVKLTIPTIINAHVCHLCNFIQLKRGNLERHYIEQHQLEKKTVDLSGYTVKLFDVQDVECVNEKNAAERETEAWKSIEKNEQVIDVDDDEISCTTITNSNNDTNQGENDSDYREKPKDKRNLKDSNDMDIEATKKSIENNNQTEIVEIQSESPTTPEKEKKINPIVNNKQSDGADQAKKTIKLPNEKSYQRVEAKACQRPNSGAKVKNKKDKKISITDMVESQSQSDFEMIDEEIVVKNIQDELLALAAKAAEREDEIEKSKANISENPESSSSNDNETSGGTTSQELVSDSQTPKAIEINNKTASEKQTTISDIISSSIDMIYNRVDATSPNKATVEESSLEVEPVRPAASNVFVPTREENCNSPTIQILAQSIISIEENENDRTIDKPVTMAERLSQRLKDLNNDSTTSEKSNASTTASICNKNPSENVFAKLLSDTLLELTKEKDSAPTNQATTKTPPAGTFFGNIFQQIFRNTLLDLEKGYQNDHVGEPIQPTQQKDIRSTDVITVISDDEDWEDIEITETAPAASTPTTSNGQKSKNKGLFQKYGIFKGNSTKSKKHLTPMMFLPKKKKEKLPQAVTLSHSSTTTTSTTTTTTTTPSTPAVTKANELATTTSCNSLSNSSSHVGFKPVINMMDGLFPDSPCNDPIDLVPELAPLEPLQDLNDISSILDSNLSAVNINASDNHTSIEDALDFISEQQANDKQTATGVPFSILPSQAKTTINNISHVGFSVQSGEGNSFKFYCLLQNCSFLYSSDAMGLENHFMCEHSQIKWNGYCLMCQSKCFPSDGDVGEEVEYSISKEIVHMMEKHANKPPLDLNTDSTQHSTTSSHDNEERPKIKLRRLTGDCLSRATPEQCSASTNDIVESVATTNESAASLSLLGALLVADPKPPTKEMPPQPQMTLTEPILLDNAAKDSPQIAFSNVSSDFLITFVTSAVPTPNETPTLQIANVISLSNNATPTPPPPQTPQTPATTTELEKQVQIPKISNVRTLAPKAGSLWTPQTEKDPAEVEDSIEDCIKVCRILKKTRTDSTSREVPRAGNNDSPVLVAETVPLAQSKTGDFVVTQTVSAQYSEFSSTALGFNISIAASTAGDKSNQELATPTNATSVSSRQYKCMGTGCKFVSRVPVAMSDHLRFHERRNLSDKQDYLICGFCFYCASDVEDYMKHANQFHIINKGAGPPYAPASTETDTVTSLTTKIQNILKNNNSSSGRNAYAVQSPTAQVQDTEEVYLKKLRETVDEIAGPTGLADDKLYRCVIKNCHSPLFEGTFLNHIMFHITTTGGNPNNYIYKCPHCTAQYHRAAGIKAHIKNHARNRYFCYLCDETSTNPGQLLKHFSEKHWHTLNMFTRELVPPKIATDGSDSVIDSSYFVAYTQELSAEEVRKFGEKLILEWQRKKCGSKTHFKSTEIDLLPLSAIFQRQVNCGECEYKTKVRTNMFRHLLMHKQNPSFGNKSGVSKVCSVDPINPVPCLNSSERFFDKMTNLASSSLVPSSSSSPSTTKPAFQLPQAFVEENKRFTCGCQDCNYHTISEDLFRAHLGAMHTAAMSYSCPFCKEEICKRGITIDRIMNHTRFHGTTIYRCEECNYIHHLRYVVDRHVNEKHAAMKVNIVTHNRSSEDRIEGTTTVISFAGKKYKETAEINPTDQASMAAATRSANCDSTLQKPPATYFNNSKLKGKWLCDMCGHRTSTVAQMQTHCQQQHSIKNQYKCVHCNFDSHQLSQILHHIDEKHPGKTREARYMFHKTANTGEELADTRPLWQRNDPTRIRHIRGILMEDEEESEEYRKKLSLAEDVDDDSTEAPHNIDVEDNDEDNLTGRNYVSRYEFGCYHCSFKTHTFEELKNQHYEQVHNAQLETAKPFWYRLYLRLCCPECRSFLGNYSELQEHLHNIHKKSRFYAADIRMAENDDTSQRILCGYCSFHCANADHLYKHHLRAQHWPQDVRIDNNEQIMDILTLGKSEVSYQCTLCADIFPNRVAIVQHACNVHAGEDSFSFRELTNSLIYRCNSCCYTSTTETELLRHTIDHYSRFKICNFCHKPQSSFNVYMQHCYGEHRNEILKFKIIYPLTDIRKLLLQILLIFPSGLVLHKRNLLNTKYGKTDIIDDVYEDMYKTSQQPPIPRLSIATLVARKSIEAQQKHDHHSTTLQDDVLEAMHTKSTKNISKRRRTMAFSREDHLANNNSLLKPKSVVIKGLIPATVIQRRTTIDNDKEHQQPQIQNAFNPPLKYNKIDKRRSTVAVDRETLFSPNLSSSSANALLTEIQACGKKRKSSYTHVNTPSPKYVKEVIYPMNLDMEPFSFYGQTPEVLDLTKIYTNLAIGGINTPVTVDKFKSLFNIDCQLKLIKCDEKCVLLDYDDYKHIKKACPASQKLKHN